MLEMFKGQLSLTDFSKEMTYREALQLREIRYERLVEEAKQAEEERKAQENAMRNNK